MHTSNGSVLLFPSLFFRISIASSAPIVHVDYPFFFKGELLGLGLKVGSEIAPKVVDVIITLACAVAAEATDAADNRMLQVEYPTAHIVNSTPYYMGGMVTFSSVAGICGSGHTFANVEAGARREDLEGRSDCLINEITAHVIKGGEEVECSPYKSSGTSYSSFIVALNGNGGCEVTRYTRRALKDLEEKESSSATEERKLVYGGPVYCPDRYTNKQVRKFMSVVPSSLLPIPLIHTPSLPHRFAKLKYAGFSDILNATMKGYTPDECTPVTAPMCVVRIHQPNNCDPHWAPVTCTGQLDCLYQNTCLAAAAGFNVGHSCNAL